MIQNGYCYSHKGWLQEGDGQYRMVIVIVTWDVCRRGTIQNDYCYSHMGCPQEEDDTERLLL